MKRILEIICLVFVLLWTYAAVSKILDYETFHLQLAKSPMLTLFAPKIAWSVPAVEIIIALLLVARQTRLYGLYASLFLMALFTGYIIMTLQFSYYIPCSCGGILEQMTWTQHIYFNLFFGLLAATGILIESKDTAHTASPARIAT